VLAVTKKRISTKVPPNVTCSTASELAAWFGCIETMHRDHAYVDTVRNHRGFFLRLHYSLPLISVIYITEHAQLMPAGVEKARSGKIKS
jgi:hypothetical protein